MLTQQARSLIEADVANKVCSRNACNLLYLSMELASADAHLSTQLVHLELAIANVLVDSLHDAVHQLVVVRLYLDRLYLDVHNLALLCLHTAELTAQATHIVHHIVYLKMEFLDVERLRDVGIGTISDAAKTVFNLRLRCKEDYRQMTYLAVSLDALEQFDAVHNRHHDICHDNIEVLL